MTVATAAVPAPAASADPAYDAAINKVKNDLRARRQSMTLFRRPLATLWEFAKVLFGYARGWQRYFAKREPLMYAILLAATLLVGLWYTPGPHQWAVQTAYKFAYFSAYWVGLGVLSSIGLGTGLHTFLLYTGPFIAKTAFAAATCGNLAFATEGPDAFKCVTGAPKGVVGFTDVMAKVALVACLWGAGTAIGELPPYFVSRAAARSGKKLAELEEIDEDEAKAQPSLMDRVKVQLFHGLQRWGFIAIVACASVPNPLFDLAGITCGHFQVPFWTFFGATFIGKAIIKMSLQSAFVIALFEPARLKLFIDTFIPGSWHDRAIAAFDAQKATYLDGNVKAGPAGGLLSTAWDVFLTCMILYFLISIVHSSVQERLVVKDQATVEKYKAEYYLKKDVTAALGGGNATPVATPAATPAATPLASPAASPAVSRASSRTSSPARPATRTNSGAGAASPASAPGGAPLTAAALAAVAPTAPAASASASASASGSAEDVGGDESSGLRGRSRSGAKRQDSAKKLTRGRSKSKLTVEDATDDTENDAAVAASFTPQRLTRSASRTTRSSARKLV